MVPLLLATGVYWLHHVPEGTGSRVTDNIVEVRLIDASERNEQRHGVAEQATRTAPQPQSQPLIDHPNRSIPAESPPPAPEPDRASQTASASPASAPASSMAPVPTPPDQMTARFQRALLGHIAHYRQYPDAARRDRAQGTVQLMFEMQRDGTVTDIWIKSSSGNRMLDVAAVETIRRAQPLPKIPSGLPDHLNIQMPLAFDLL